MNPSVNRAEVMARLAHAGQVDKQGRDYADHHLKPIADSLVGHGGLAVIAGWLHDIVEDTSWTVAEVEQHFGPVVARAVDSVTRRQGETYAELIARAAADPLGRFVKLADNAHNLASNESLAAIDPEAAARLRKRYETARRTLLTTA